MMVRVCSKASAMRNPHVDPSLLGSAFSHEVATTSEIRDLKVVSDSVKEEKLGLDFKCWTLILLFR